MRIAEFKKSEIRNQLVTRYSSLSLCCLLFTIYCLLLVAACAHTPPTLSDTHLRAAEFDQKAENAFKKGDYKKALNLYNEALKVNRSIENFDGITKNLINMTIVYRELKDRENAYKCLNEIFRDSNELNGNDSLLPAHYPLLSVLSEASFVKAMLYLDENNYEKAYLWADRALSFCKTECNMEGKIYNLKGRIALLKGELSNAETFTTMAMELNKKSKDREEEANSLRIIAEIKLKKKEHNDAKRLFENALIIDKSLGLSRKIAFDLMGIGNTLFAEDNPQEALQYFKRALSVNEGADDKQGIKDARDMIDKCLEKLKRQ